MIIIVFLVLVIAAAVLVVLRSDEDDWICQDGEWVAHGKPSSPKPQTSCGDEKARPEINEEKTIDKKAETEEAQKVSEGPNIKIVSPSADSVVASPLKITGEAKGWYFEASFPIRLVDEKGNVLARGLAQAKSDWMVDAFVPFESELNFNPGGAKSGEIIFEKDNPSGRPENSGSFSLPVLFKD